MKNLILFSLFCCLSASSANKSHLGHIHTLQIFCDMKCSCPLQQPNWTLLECDDIGIRHLPSNLQIISPIKKLSFRNNQITELTNTTFSRAEAVEELDLSNNEISDIEEFAFDPFRFLTFLRLSHNQIFKISPETLHGLANLRYLELGSNRIHHLSHLAFRQTPKLQELRLHQNPLFELPERLFEFLPNLLKLDLQETGLVSLPDTLFIKIPKLRWLSLADNAFERVPVISSLTLAHLDLSGNDFTVLGTNAFSRLGNLSLLNLNNLQRLTQIEEGAFLGLTKLKTLSCTSNPKLTTIHRDAFGNPNFTHPKSYLPSEQLFLGQNNLRTLLTSLEVEKWLSLIYVDFGDNSWTCDCKLRWMTHLTAEAKMTVICERPAHLRGLSLNEMHPDDLTCGDGWGLATFVLAISCMIAFGVIFLAASAIVCSRTSLGLYVRAKKQFLYAKVVSKADQVELEWDPSGEM